MRACNKLALLLLLINSIWVSVFSQNGVFSTQFELDQVKGAAAIELANDYLIIAEEYVPVIEQSKVHLFLIGSKGQLINRKELISKYGYQLRLPHIKKFENGNVLLVAHAINFSNHQGLCFIVLNDKLELIMENYYFESGKNINSSGFEFLADSTLILHFKDQFHFDTSAKHYLAEIHLSGILRQKHLITSIHPLTPASGFNYFKEEKLCHVLYRDRLLIFDSLFSEISNIQYTDTVGRGSRGASRIHPTIREYLSFTHDTRGQWTSVNSVYVSKWKSSGDIALFSLDSSLILADNDTDSYPVFNAVDFVDTGYVYACYINGYEQGYLPYGERIWPIGVSCFSWNGDIRWEKSYAFNGQHIQLFTLATSDGGVLVLSELYDWVKDTTQIKWLHILKIDSLGGYSYFDPNSSVEESFDSNIEISCYPNPVSHTLYLSSNSMNQIDWSLHNINGQHISSGGFRLRAFMDVSEIPSGFYFLHITSRDYIKTLKVLVQH